MSNYREERLGTRLTQKDTTLLLKWLIWWCAYEWSTHATFQKRSKIRYDYVCKDTKTGGKKVNENEVKVMEFEIIYFPSSKVILRDLFIKCGSSVFFGLQILLKRQQKNQKTKEGKNM